MVSNPSNPPNTMNTKMAPSASPKFWFFIELIRYSYPVVVFFYFIISLTVTIVNANTQPLRVKDQHVRRGVIMCLTITLGGTYIAEIVAVILKAATEGWYPGQDHVVYLISSVLVILIQILALSDTAFPVWYPYYGTWILGLLVELTLTILPNILQPPQNPPFDYIFIVVQAFRITNLVLLPLTYIYLRNDEKTYDTGDAERQSLLHNNGNSSKPSTDASAANGNGYGTTIDVDDEEGDSDNESVASDDSWDKRDDATQEAMKKRLQEDGGLWRYFKEFFDMFFPLIWPVNNKKLQFRAFLVALTLLATNSLSLLYPIMFGKMIESLIKYTQGDHTQDIWTPIIVYCGLNFIRSGGCISVLKFWLWVPVEHHAYRTISTHSHAHVMSLSTDFHDDKTTSEVNQSLNGGRSVVELLEIGCFKVVPTFIDLIIAFVYFSAYGPYMFLVLAVSSISYMYISLKLSAMRSADRRRSNNANIKEWVIGQESIENWTTANMFNMVPYEGRRYSAAVRLSLKLDKVVDLIIRFSYLAQALVMTCGLTGVLCLGAWQVAYEGRSVGNITTLLAFWGQLRNPLDFFSSAHQTISRDLIKAERLLKLLQTQPTLKDAPDAKPLVLTECKVEFNDVSFSYDERKQTLKNITFSALGGTTIAFVGETGGGKSTLLKLMDRFYDVKSGSIKFDGQDIRDVTMESLRSNVGVVPQDPALFNCSIMRNLRYARRDATKKEVYEACKAAVIHDKIMKFPDGYKSKVGQNGVKLSGGEKQRIAIARAILKQPKIILLDEATSAVDTETEQMIQKGLQKLCKGRTTFVVAHRLSTVMSADRIVVIMDGQIVEQGSHDELFHSKGKYADLWSKQVFVKPSEPEPESASRGPAKKDANIVNDMAPQQNIVNLAKAAKAVDHAQPDGAASLSPGKDSESKDKSGSKLKANAPEFVPLDTKKSHIVSQKTNIQAPIQQSIQTKNVVFGETEPAWWERPRGTSQSRSENDNLEIIDAEQKHALRKKQQAASTAASVESSAAGGVTRTNGNKVADDQILIHVPKGAEAAVNILLGEGQDHTVSKPAGTGITPQATRVTTKEAMKEQRRRDKALKKEESLKRKAVRKLGRKGKMVVDDQTKEVSSSNNTTGTGTELQLALGTDGVLEQTEPYMNNSYADANSRRRRDVSKSEPADTRSGSKDGEGSFGSGDTLIRRMPGLCAEGEGEGVGNGNGNGNGVDLGRRMVSAPVPVLASTSTLISSSTSTLTAFSSSATVAPLRIKVKAKNQSARMDMAGGDVLDGGGEYGSVSASASVAGSVGKANEDEIENGYGNGYVRSGYGIGYAGGSGSAAGTGRVLKIQRALPPTPPGYARALKGDGGLRDGGMREGVMGMGMGLGRKRHWKIRNRAVGLMGVGGMSGGDGASGGRREGGAGGVVGDKAVVVGESERRSSLVVVKERGKGKGKGGVSVRFVDGV